MPTKNNAEGYIDHISPTQINMILRCPKQWEFRYVKGLKLPPSGAMVLGSAYHEGIAESFRYVIAEGQQATYPHTLDIALDAFDTTFERIKSEHMVREDDEDMPFDEIKWEEAPGKLKDIGVRLVTYYEEFTAPTITPIAVEQKEFIIVTDVPIHMVVDLETEQKLVDHKVKGRRFSESDLAQDIQATAYWMAKDKQLEFHVGLKNHAHVIVQPANRTAQDAQFFVTELVPKVWQQIQSGVFPPNPVGWHCSENWCGYWNLCKGRTQ